MVVLTANIIDLAILQDELQPAFDNYDAAVDTGVTAACRAARARIMNHVRSAIDQAIDGWTQGLYLFADRRKAAVDGLIYIGCAHRGDLRRRLEQYLIRDVSSMDLRMRDRTIDERSAVADRRLATTMPNTAPPTRAQFVNGHLRSVRLAMGGSLFVAPSVSGQVTVGAEGMLICTAWSLGACLENLKCEWPSVDLRAETRDHAVATLEAWQRVGLGDELAKLWTDSLSWLCVG
jgi:hypothetical protein